MPTTDTTATCRSCQTEFKPDDGENAWEVWTLDEDENIKVDLVGHCSEPCIHA